MSLRVLTVLAAAGLLLAPATGHAALSAYTQNFETLLPGDLTALSGDGWLVYGNVFTPAHVYMYGYGPFPAPNDGAAFCAVTAGQGGAEQGAMQLSVYSDYNNLDHANGNLIESNVYHEQTVALGDVGQQWTFQFDAKLGNLAGASTALAFIKTLNPSAGYQLTNFITADMTAIPATWGTYTLSINVDASLVGQLMQFGFASTATHYEASGVYYDNLTWHSTTGVDVARTPRTAGLELRAPAPNPSAGATRLDFVLAQRGTADVSVYDVAGRRVATLFHGVAEPGPHAATWDGRTVSGQRAPAGVYRCVLRTGAGQRTQSLVVSR